MCSKLGRILIVTMGLAMALALAPTTASALTGPHDLSLAVAIGPSNKLCGACHTPHNAIAGQPIIWAQTISGATFTMYGPTVQGTPTDATPTGTSILCLSCHDGVTTILATGAVMGAGPEVIGVDLKTSHPVSIDYGGVAKGLVAVPSVAKLTTDNKVQCASCHDPHVNTESAYLRGTNVNSQLCQDCHNK